MKKIITSLLAASTFFLADAQQVINLLTGEVREGSDAAGPVKTVETLDDGYLVTYEFTEAVLEKDPYLSDCILWKYPNFMVSDINGSPAFPYQNGWVDIDDYTPTIMVEDSSYMDYSYQLAPAYPPQPISNPYSEIERLPISPYSGFSHISLVETIGFRRFSGRRQVLFTVYPIQYSYEQQIIRAYTKISVKITLSDNTTGIEELKSKCDASKCSFTLDGRPVKGNVKGVTVRNGQKIIVK